MSKLEKLIQQYCPDGVEWKMFYDVCDLIRGITYNKSQEAKTETEDTHKVLRANNITLYLNVLNFEDVKLVSKDVVVKPEQHLYAGDILMCAGSGSKEHVGKVAFISENIDYTFGGFMAVVRCKAGILPRYMFHILSSHYFSSHLDVQINSSTINNINKQVMQSFAFPVPPLPVQEEIVRVLDAFTELQAELQAELQKRKQQYNYYLDNLLNFKNINRGGQEIKWIKLKDVATQWYRGAGIKREEVGNEGMPCIRYGEIHTSYNIWFKDCISHTDETKQATKKYAEYGDILFAITSEDIPLVGNSVAYLGKEKIMVGGDIVVMKHNQDPRYMAYALSTSDAIKQKGKGKVKSKVVHTNVPSLQEIVIPIPPMEEQQRIADILDRFDTLTNDLTSGLPAEMEKRRLQYEFYRDKLLTFKRKEA